MLKSQIIQGKIIVPQYAPQPCKLIRFMRMRQGKRRGQEQVLEVHDKPAMRGQKRVRKVRKTDSEKITEEESGETKGQEQVVEELDDAPVVNVSDELVGEIKRLIEKFSLEEVKKALDIAECDI